MSAPEDVSEKAGPSGKQDFRTISAVAKHLGVGTHVLRFWENKFPQISPLKRRGGRRFYRPEDVRRLEEVRDLLYHQGYTIRGVQKLLKQRESSRPAVAVRPEETGTPAESASLVPSQVKKDLVRVLDELKRLKTLVEKAHLMPETAAKPVSRSPEASSQTTLFGE
jgi:DNA-binding transcriptional MerR regulator